MIIRARAAAILFTTLSIVVLLAAMLAVVPTRTVQASGTYSITVSLYDTSEQLVENITLSLNDLKNLPVQGNGTIHYYHQGPTFNESDLWDQSETVNLKDMGALKGADVKDICEALTNPVPSDAEIQIVASDSYSKTFDYDDIYYPEAEQGKLVVCYEKDGVEVPTWSDGLRLVFFAQTTNVEGKYVFGNWDMNQTLDEDEWHLYNNYWPSTHGLSVKYVNQINIYDQ